MSIETRTASISLDEQADAAPGVQPELMASDYRRVRARSEQLCEPLETEDYCIQSMPDVSPAKWHLAHTTWFFETFLLQPFVSGYGAFHPRYAVLFNSYYNAVGPQYPRPRRGLLSRPTVDEVYQYRKYVDERMIDLLDGADDAKRCEIHPLLALGLHHEQQHQELMLTDIKHVFAANPLRPAYREEKKGDVGVVSPLGWKDFDGRLCWIGHDGSGFAYDNESPRHQTFVHPHRLATRLTTNGEFMDFMADGGYERPELWLSEGWAMRQAEGWRAPLYWERQGDRWWYMTLSGMREVEKTEPVCHVSYYEADAFARWCGRRVPTEAEWESAAAEAASDGNFADDDHYHPVPAGAEKSGHGLMQMFGDVWEWTGSAYLPYPGYRAAEGAVGEYNGKFMCQQFVLRGGSCATARLHIRPTYRNFFPPSARWQFTGIRLADDANPGSGAT